MLRSKDIKVLSNKKTPSELRNQIKLAVVNILYLSGIQRAQDGDPVPISDLKELITLIGDAIVALEEMRETVPYVNFDNIAEEFIGSFENHPAMKVIFYACRQQLLKLSLQKKHKLKRFPITIKKKLP